jgi:hypothetical protein
MPTISPLPEFYALTQAEIKSALAA